MQSFYKSRKHPKRKTIGLKGYRLHDARIAYSGGEGSTRSIKYELKNPDGLADDLRDKLAQAIYADNKALFGNINFNDYLEWRKDKTDGQIKNGEREPSLLGFWIKALSLGFVFSKQSHAVFDFYYSEKQRDELWNRIAEDLRGKLNKERWFQFYSARKDGKTKVSGVFKKKLDESGKETKELVEGADEIIKKYDNLLNDNYNELVVIVKRLEPLLVGSADKRLIKLMTSCESLIIKKDGSKQKFDVKKIEEKLKKFDEIRNGDDKNKPAVVSDAIEDVFGVLDELTQNGNSVARVKLFIPDYEEENSVDKKLGKAGGENEFPKYACPKLNKSGESQVDKDGSVKMEIKNVSWHCNPDVTFSEKDLTKMLDEIIRFYNEKYGLTENKKDDGTSNRMGLYSLNQGLMYGVLGNFFDFIKSGEFNDYLERVKNFFGYSDDEVTIIDNKLHELSKYAEGIAARPFLADSWAKYYGQFGGVLESWYSNRAEKLKKIPEQISGLHILLEEIERALQEHGDASEELKTLQTLKSEIRSYRAVRDKPENISFSWHVHKNAAKTKKAEDYDIFVEKMADRDFTERTKLLIADLRSQLNAYNQQNKVKVKKKKSYKVEEVGVLDNVLNKAKADENGENKNGWQKKLSEKIQAAPLFFGESKRQMFEQTYQLKSLVCSEIDKVKKVLEEAKDIDKIEVKSEPETKTDKGKSKGGNYTINVLARFYSRFTDKNYNGNNEVKTALEGIAKELGIENEFKEYKDDNNKWAKRFYLSGRERQDFNLVKFERTLTANRILEISKLAELLEKCKTDFNKDNLLRDVVQLSKTVSALVLTSTEKKEQIENTYTHSKLGGYVSIISKQHFISRYQVQVAGSDGNGNNNFAGGNQVTLGIGMDKSKKGDEIERYFYAFKMFKCDESLKTTLNKICKAKDNTENPETDIVETASKYSALKVESSKYQIQFLEWFFGKCEKKKTNLKLAGAFTILEKESKLNWDGENPTCEASTENRVFVSQPFTLVPKNAPEFSPEKIKNRYIGVDIGEYGLAWSLIVVDDSDKNDIKVKQEGHGFIADSQQQVLKNEVKSWRQNQVRQTFTSMDTKVARLRESLIGSYKNQLESLVLTQNATLSFEYEVSGFEVGGNRIAKIYDSIKKGSVKRDNDTENIQAWGGQKAGPKLVPIKSHNWALETTDAGTSQFCTACKTWASLDIDDNAKYEIENYEDGLFKAKLDSNRYVRLFAPKNSKAGDLVAGKDLKGMIYKAMRPNEDGLGMKIVERKLGPVKFNKLMEDFGAGKKRGNIGVFVCPYIDCHHIADADKQAAFNIAIRGYLKSANPDLAEKTGAAGLSRERLTEMESKLSFDPIGLQ